MLQQEEDSDSSFEEYSKPEFVFKFDIPPQNNIETAIIATNGPQSIYIKTQLSKSTKLGNLNFSKATQSSLATIYKLDKTLAIVFNKQIKDYHFNDYNFGEALIQFLPEHQNIQFVIFDDTQSQSLITICDKPLYLRQLSTQNNKFKCTLPAIESPNEFQELIADIFSELWTRQCSLLVLLMIRQEYQVAQNQMDALEQICDELKILNSKGLQYGEDIKKMNRERNKNTIYL